MLQNIPDTKELCNINIFDLEGGLFEETNSVEEIAFKYAVDHINRFDFSSNVDNYMQNKVSTMIRSELCSAT